MRRLRTEQTDKVDASGNVQWSRVVGGLHAYGIAVKELPDGGYILAGDSADEVFLLRLDAAGSNVWRRSYYGVTETWVCDLGIATDGDFLISGGTDGTSFLARVDLQGHLKWQRELSEEGDAGWSLTTQTTAALSPVVT